MPVRSLSYILCCACCVLLLFGCEKKQSATPEAEPIGSPNSLSTPEAAPIGSARPSSPP